MTLNLQYDILLKVKFLKNSPDPSKGEGDSTDPRPCPLKRFPRSAPSLISSKYPSFTLLRSSNPKQC